MGCSTVTWAAVALPHTGPQEAPQTIQGAICAYTHSHPPAQHLPAHLHAHPASAFNPRCFLMQSENYTRTYNPQNGGSSLKCLCAWVFSSKGYFSLIELQRFQFNLFELNFSLSRHWIPDPSCTCAHLPLVQKVSFLFVFFFNYPFYVRMINHLCLFLVMSLLQKILFQ